MLPRDCMFYSDWRKRTVNLLRCRFWIINMHIVGIKFEEFIFSSQTKTSIYCIIKNIAGLRAQALYSYGIQHMKPVSMSCSSLSLFSFHFIERTYFQKITSVLWIKGGSISNFMPCKPVVGWLLFDKNERTLARADRKSRDYEKRAANPHHLDSTQPSPQFIPSAANNK